MDDTLEVWAQDTVRLLRTLPGQSVTVLSLMYFSRLNEAQICAHTGWSTQSVRAAAAAGLSELGRLLQADAVGTGHT